MEGTKPIFFDVGWDEGKMKEALEHCRKHLGDNVTILYESNYKTLEMVMDQGKEKGGPWDCYYAGNFYGWEAERVVVVTAGWETMEMITRARTHLAVILVGGKDNENKKHFLLAKNTGLVDSVHVSGPQPSPHDHFLQQLLG